MNRLLSRTCLGRTIYVGFMQLQITGNGSIILSKSFYKVFLFMGACYEENMY